MTIAQNCEKDSGKIWYFDRLPHIEVDKKVIVKRSAKTTYVHTIRTAYYVFCHLNSMNYRKKGYLPHCWFHFGWIKQKGTFAMNKNLRSLKRAWNQ